MNKYIPTLLSMDDMIDNGLEIDIQRKVVQFANLEQGLWFEFRF